LESPLKTPRVAPPLFNEAQGWCAVCRDPRLEDSFQARACIDDLKEVSVASVKCGTESQYSEFSELSEIHWQ